MKSIYLVRHGETELNLKKVYYGRIDCDLTEKGMSQAKALQPFFSRLKPDLVYVSPLLRATHTADLLLGETKVARICDERLSELSFGQWEGKHYESLKGDPLYEKWCADWRHQAPPEGESFCDMAKRTRSFFNVLQKKEEDTVLIVSHHAVLQQLMAYLLEEAAEHCWHYAFSQGAYSEFSFSSGFAVLKGHNVVPFSEN
ncbi:MAG TPA: alpha-ribazole phosphatase [Clostridiales bacterium]|nr:alpha-ribazole phosphatase [Clostridiales bacterium]